MRYYTPSRVTLEEGKYEIKVPPTWESNGIRYNFWSWENGEKTPTRFIELNSDKNIEASYIPYPVGHERKVGNRVKKTINYVLDIIITTVIGLIITYIIKFFL